MPESEGTVTLGDMKAWPREDQQKYYTDLYFVYSLNERDGHEETADRQRRQLAAMQRLWGFTTADIAVMEAYVAKRLAKQRQEYPELFEGPVGPPTKH